MGKNLIGQEINGYHFVSVIGQGGMGTVYKVHNGKLNSNYAIKVVNLSGHGITNPNELIDQFKKEMEILKNVKHPRIPKIYDFFEDKGTHFLVMEHIQGNNLEELLNTNGKFDEKKVVKWALEILNILDYLHSHNIYYRDLKPANIMVDNNDDIRLVDFGISRLVQNPKTKFTFIGTIGFVAPEVSRWEYYPSSDLYSLGVMITTLLTGKWPDNPNFFQMENFCSQNTANVIKKALFLDPNQRHQSTKEMINALKQGDTELRSPTMANVYRLIENLIKEHKSSSSYYYTTTHFTTILKDLTKLELYLKNQEDYKIIKQLSKKIDNNLQFFVRMKTAHLCALIREIYEPNKPKEVIKYYKKMAQMYKRNFDKYPDTKSLQVWKKMETMIEEREKQEISREEKIETFVSKWEPFVGNFIAWILAEYRFFFF